MLGRWRRLELRPGSSWSDAQGLSNAYLTSQIGSLRQKFFFQILQASAKKSTVCQKTSLNYGDILAKLRSNLTQRSKFHVFFPSREKKLRFPMPKLRFSMPKIRFSMPQARKSVRSPDPNYGKLRKSRVTVINKGLHCSLPTDRPTPCHFGRSGTWDFP